MTLIRSRRVHDHAAFEELEVTQVDRYDPTEELGDGRPRF